jgi:hypothetical protein
VKFALTFGALGCLSFTMAAADDYLEPCRVSMAEYESRVESISRTAMPGEAEFWVTVIPSFQPEWSVGVSSDGGRYFVTHVIFQQSLWGRSLVQSGPNKYSYDFSKPDVRTTRHTVVISDELHRALRSEWERSIASARPAEGLGLDGVTFKFELSGRCGSAWSPDPETPNGKLVDLVMSLARFADTNNGSSRATGEAAIRRKLQRIHPPQS